MRDAVFNHNAGPIASIGEPSGLVLGQRLRLASGGGQRDLAGEDGGGDRLIGDGDAELGAEVNNAGIAGMNRKALGGFGLTDADEFAGVQAQGVVVVEQFDRGRCFEDGDRAAVGRDLGEAGGEGEGLVGV